MQFRFTLKDKTAFYLRYFISKVFCLWFEVRKPKLRLFLYEIVYSAKKFINYESLYPCPFDTDMVETIFGKFRIRPHTADMSNVSPAFERSDVDYLLRLIKRLRNEKKKILFLDIGSDLGTYAVTIANRFKDYESIKILAFEPAKSSHELLKENIRLNGLSEKVEPYNFALFSEDNKELELEFDESAPGVSTLKASGSEKVIARTLDSVIAKDIKNHDAIVLKIDVEGVETEVLRGAERMLGSGMEAYLLVEDFVNPEIVSYLNGIGAEFITKLTPYNSWWHYCHKKP